MSKNTVSPETLFKTIAECDLFLQRFNEGMDWSSPEALKASALTKVAKVQDMIKTAHENGILNADWMQASIAWLGDNPESLTIADNSMGDPGYDITSRTHDDIGQRHFLGNRIATGLDLTKTFAIPVQFIKESATLILSHSVDENINTKAHYTNLLNAKRDHWSPAELAA